MKKRIAYRIYINFTPLEDLTQSERAAVVERCVEKMGGALNDWFAHHPKELERMVKND